MKDSVVQENDIRWGSGPQAGNCSAPLFKYREKQTRAAWREKAEHWREHNKSSMQE